MVSLLVFHTACQETNFPSSSKTTPTADWGILFPDTANDTGHDTGQLDNAVVVPRQSAVGFGNALICGTQYCWASAPFGPNAELYAIDIQAQRTAILPTGTGQSLSLLNEIVVLSGPEGLYLADGLFDGLGQTGVISCGEAKCASVLKSGLWIDEPITEHRPKAIVHHQDQWVWQNENGQIEKSSGEISEWSGPEIQSMSVIDNSVWVGSPHEGCAHRLNIETLELNESWCNGLLSFAYSISVIAENEIFIGAPSALGGKGYVGFWKDGAEIWKSEGRTLGEGFGSALQYHRDKILVGAPSASGGQGLIYMVEWDE
ncbi:MAG: hypothetical protein ACON4U_08640 [Myxococcota bacterium]